MSDFVNHLLSLPDLSAQKACLATHPSCIDDVLVHRLKDEATQVLRVNVQKSLDLAILIDHIAALTGDPLHRALGLLARANALSLGGLGDYQQAVALYGEAASIYRQHEMPVQEAVSQIANILALAHLGNYTEALTVGGWAASVLEAHGEWLQLAKVTSNLGVIRHRLGQDLQALTLFDHVRATYQKLPDNEEVQRSIARVEHNRATVLRNLGRFDESIAASHAASDLLNQTGQPAEAARNQQNLAITYFILGRYNEALNLLDQAQQFFFADGRQRDAILIELFMSDCLLQLRRFDEVLEKVSQVRHLFTKFGSDFEVAQSLLHEATAHAGRRRYDLALEALAEVRSRFLDSNNATWTAIADIERAAALYHLERFEESYATAQSTLETFDLHNLPVEQAHAYLMVARAALALQRPKTARQMIDAARSIGEQNDLPSILYLSHHLQGEVAEGEQRQEDALHAYIAAMDEVERLRRQLMIEFRIEFLEDKQSVYEDAVSMCVTLDRPAQGLSLVERAKSRTLRELLDYRIEVGITAANAEDRELIEQLQRLKSERDQIYRRWAGNKEVNVRGWISPDGRQEVVQKEVLAIEKHITSLWHRLLIRNADYADKALFWQIESEPAFDDLDADTMLIEYFIARGALLAFVITAQEVTVYRLPCRLSQIEQMLSFLALNFHNVANNNQAQMKALMSNARGILHELYNQLLPPLLLTPGNLVQRRYPKLIIVPHGALHYLPFHALFDGQTYLAEHYEVSYLPGASLLRHLNRRKKPMAQVCVLGHSQNGLLPYTLEEAKAVAAQFQTTAYLEGEASIERIRDMAGECRLLHLATHGDFRPDNPLFSGLSLADGWLTTLDIFNLRLQASLVTLSACQTGRNVIGGGDELLGLMRAFLYAGASSLLLSLWAVEDQSTSHFMQHFYAQLASGASKGAALRQVQQMFIAGDTHSGYTKYSHPYYWAPFTLVGHTGRLDS